MLIPAFPQTSKLDKQYSICNTSEVYNLSFVGATPTQVKSDFDSRLSLVYFEIVYPSITRTSINNVNIFCRGFIPLNTLSKANSLKILVSSNQQIKIAPSIRRVGQGPLWLPFEGATKKLNEPILHTQPLDIIPDYPKITLLSGDYEGINFSLDGYDSNKPLVLRIYEVYLE